MEISFIFCKIKQTKFFKILAYFAKNKIKQILFNFKVKNKKKTL